jgi:anti-sigma B factor antagonist
VVTAKDPPSEHAEPPAADDHSTDLTGTAALAAAGLSKDPANNAASELLSLTVEHPANGVCVITVDGELDMFTAPLLEACLREQLCTNPRHLIVDLQPVCFLASHGLNCLLQARENARTTATQLYLAGLVTHAVARPLQVSQLLELFNTYPTLTHALTAIID